MIAIRTTKATTALIVGGGIAGTVTALALQRAGIDCIVCEGHRRGADDVGSYLTVASNGFAALANVDAGDLVRAGGFPTPSSILETDSGKQVARVPLGSTRPGAPATCTIRRSRLYAALRDEAMRRGIAFAFDKRLVAVANQGHIVEAAFADGATISAELLIGADGVHSTTRRIIDPAAPPPRYVGLLNFGGYTRGVPHHVEPGVWHMAFGQRAFFGYVADNAGGTVWFANVPHVEIPRENRDARAADRWRDRLIDLFSADKTPACELISSGELELVADNTYDLPTVPAWHRGPMVIIGDAAHAPSPSSGQGASLAIEDGIVLAKCLRDCRDPHTAFAAYEHERRARVERVVEHGARMSSNKTPGRFGRLLRDLTLPVVLRLFAGEKSLQWLFDYRIDWECPVQ